MDLEELLVKMDAAIRELAKQEENMAKCPDAEFSSMIAEYRRRREIAMEILMERRMTRNQGCSIRNFKRERRNEPDNDQNISVRR